MASRQRVRLRILRRSSGPELGAALALKAGLALPPVGANMGATSEDRIELVKQTMKKLEEAAEKAKEDEAAAKKSQGSGGQGGQGGSGGADGAGGAQGTGGANAGNNAGSGMG